MYGVIWSLDKQKYLLIGQVIANYVVHFLLLWLLLSVDVDRNLAIIISVVTTYCVMDISGIIIMVCSDWTECSNKIRLEFDKDTNGSAKKNKKKDTTLTIYNKEGNEDCESLINEKNIE